MVVITIVRLGYKPTYNVWGPHIVDFPWLAILSTGKRLQKTMERSTMLLMGKLTINDHFQ